MKYFGQIFVNLFLLTRLNWHHCNLCKKYKLLLSKSSHIFDECDIYVEESKPNLNGCNFDSIT